MSNKGRDRYILLAVILVALAFVIFFSWRTYSNYVLWKNQHNYFKKPGQEIESWMTLKMISERFNISHTQLLEEMGVNKTLNPHITLDVFCKQYKQNCTSLLERLNARIAK